MVNGTWRTCQRQLNDFWQRVVLRGKRQGLWDALWNSERLGDRWVPEKSRSPLWPSFHHPPG